MGIAYVTGGTSGMGLAAAKALAARGMHVAVFSSRAAPEAVAQVEAARRARDQRIAWFGMDVSDRDAVLAAFASATEACGAPDLVIHMAGVSGLAPMADMQLETFDRVFKVNVYGTRHVVEASLVTMCERGAGKIVLAGSLGGFVPVYGYTAYGASKFAVVGFAECLRCELEPLGIEVACFCPGQVDTPGLAAEGEHPVAATTAMKKLGGTVSVDDAVRGLMKGIASRRFLIIPGARAKVLYWIRRVTPLPIWGAVTRRIVNAAARDDRAAKARQQRAS